MRKSRSARRGRLLTVCGTLLIAAALGLTAYNLWDESQAASRADGALERLTQRLPEEPPASTENEELVIPDYILDPSREMPVTEIDGNDYVGVLEIPALGLSLPVMDQWSYPGLKTAPCRYTGSAYANDLVIAAHNYQRHFGQIKELSSGDEVTFTDMDGNIFRYEVAETEVLQPTAVEEMTSGDWPLTLFTCTVGGQYRVAVRCAEAEA